MRNYTRSQHQNVPAIIITSKNETNGMTTTRHDDHIPNWYWTEANRTYKCKGEITNEINRKTGRTRTEINISKPTVCSRRPRNETLLVWCMHMEYCYVINFSLTTRLYSLSCCLCSCSCSKCPSVSFRRSALTHTISANGCCCCLLQARG